MITLMAMYLNTIYGSAYPVPICFLGDILLFIILRGTIYIDK